MGRHNRAAFGGGMLPFEMLESRCLLSTITVTSATDSGAGSLRAALASAATGDSLVFASNLAGQTISLSSTLTVNTSVSISAAAAPGLTISGNSAVRIFDIASLLNVTLDSLQLINGHAIAVASEDDGQGGAVRAGDNTTLTVTNCTITHNVADGAGGGIGLTEIVLNGGSFPTLHLTNDTISLNTAHDMIATVLLLGDAHNFGAGGGGVNSAGQPIIATNCTFNDNTTTGGSSGSGQTFKQALGGGGIDSEGGTIQLTNCTVNDNTSAGFAGGGMDSEGGAITLVSSAVNDNSAHGAGGGGGIMSEGGNVSLTGSAVNDNTEDGENATAAPTGTEGGGGISTEGGNVTLISSTISSNTSDGALGGGGILSEGGSITMTDSTVDSNTANSSAFRGNGGETPLGGGGINAEGGAITIVNSTLSANTAALQGGAILVNNVTTSHTFSLTNVTIDNNSASTGGGIFAAAGDTGSLLNTIVANSSNGNFAGGGTFTSLGHNLSSDNSGAAFLTQPGDLNSTNPNLGALANNGGPTKTELPNAGSPALNGGTTTGVTATTDQRGLPRVVNGLIDIGATESASMMDTNQCYTEALYTRVLGRTATTPEITFWTNLLDSGTLTVTQVAFQFENSHENRVNQVNAAFLRFLHRAADAPSLAGDTAALQSGSITEGLLYQNLINSAEYQAAHVSDASFIGGLFQDTLGRAATGSDITFYQTYLATNTRASLAGLIVNGSEDRTNIVDAQYLKLFSRAADPAGLAAATNLLALNNLNIAQEETELIAAGTSEFFTLAVADCTT